ncbi:MAG: hypothetical protein AAB602_03455 [Patescibacteria group bacterium]
MKNSKQISLVAGIVAVVIITFGIGYYVGRDIGYATGIVAGREKALAEFESSQEALAQKAAQDAAKAANPFQTSVNPLQGVADPLQKTKQVLNPFE